MSDSKWRKLLTLLHESELNLPACIVKWIDWPVPVLMATPSAADLHPPRGFLDSLEFGPFALGSIEWMEFPDVVPTEPRKRNLLLGPDVPIDDRYHGRCGAQQVDRAIAALVMKGQFPLERRDTGLRIIGHCHRIAPERVG
ncbi:hypothetical protein A6302_00390 [Methylobrevis pamukkalensis]|uniref:Uncharacterized protein n=2 Tax=Methylobrevis pamukkalensis TaxID=1439726 RepID=A0A1E3H854_9HYPH|nr:hypothetical protein A6302_00390 [Methylobrevis pamukkalensis]